MEPIKIYFNQINYNSELRSMEDSRDSCLSLIDKFKSLNIGEFKPAEFKQLLFSTENYLYEKTMAGQSLKVVGMTLEKKAFYEIIDKPIGYSQLVNETEKFVSMMQRRLQREGSSYDVESHLSRFLVFDENETLIVDQSSIDDLREKNTVCAYSEKAQLTYAFALELDKLFNKHDIFNKVQKVYTPGNLGTFITDIIEIDQTTQRCTIKLQGIKVFDNRP